MAIFNDVYCQICDRFYTKERWNKHLYSFRHLRVILLVYTYTYMSIYVCLPLYERLYLYIHIYEYLYLFICTLI